MGALAASFFTRMGPSRDLLLVSAVALGTIVLALSVAASLVRGLARRRLRTVMGFLEHDSAPAFCTDEDGALFFQNVAAIDRFGRMDGATMTRALEPLFANPDSVVHRLRSAATGRANAEGTAREDVVTRRGHVRVAVHRVPGGFLWRLEDLVDRPSRAPDGVGLPALTFGPSGVILYMNEALRGLAGRRAKRLRDLFETLPLENGTLNYLISESGMQPVRVAVSEPVNGRQELFLLPAVAESHDNDVLDGLPVALLRLDGSGHIIFANRHARELLPEIGEETRLAAIVEGLGRSVKDWICEATSGRGLHRAEVVRVAGIKGETYLQITLGRPLTGDEGGLIAVLNDATELKTMEAQFVQSQKMQAIGQLAGGVAHDFNNLLTAISGHCDLLLLRHAAGDPDHADLNQITQNANRAAALVGQLLAFSRKQTLEMKPVDLRDTLGDLTHLLNRLVGERISLRLEHDPALIPIRGDRRQLEQVLMNLVVNARDAMPDGGEILIETRCRYLDVALERDRVTVPPGQYVVISVQDHGTGIAREDLARIFEPFFTTKRPGEGTGLGLSMAYGIVKQSGGYIFADSEVGKGTNFSLFFTAAEAGLNMSGRAAGRPPIPLLLERVVPEALQAFATESVTERDAGVAAIDSAPPTGANKQACDVGAEHQNAQAPTLLHAGNWHEKVGEGASIGDSAIQQEAEVDPIISGMLGGMSVPATSRASLNDDLLEDEVSNLFADEEQKGALESGEDASDDRLETSTEANLKDGSESAGTSGAEMSDDRPSNAEPVRPVVLLVEDEAPVRAFASRALQLRGYDVVEAESAEVALDRLADPALRVDLFVTDVMMPGLDGPTWVRKALIDRPEVRTVFISGYTQDAMSETSAPVPNAVFLPKPFSLADLTQTVERALAMRSESSGSPSPVAERTP
ncbi:hybrid sensor histidine kinase/response regulator [Jannaschia seosinensis]|uniref:hybrid sensor histidine kinase/response regulator n=1 Tax=Jannaschia seosinensis TaxID=313367 RepID=UPI0011874395|nr:ATP-binding protein [Jannaschia seosinensis]